MIWSGVVNIYRGACPGMGGGFAAMIANDKSNYGHIYAKLISSINNNNFIKYISSDLKFRYLFGTLSSSVCWIIKCIYLIMMTQ